MAGHVIGWPWYWLGMGCAWAGHVLHMRWKLANLGMGLPSMVWPSMFMSGAWLLARHGLGRA
jgi:hypothetical protein